MADGCLNFNEYHGRPAAAINQLGTRQLAADKMPPLKDRLERGKQVPPRLWFVNVTKRTQAKRLLHHFVGTLVREE